MKAYDTDKPEAGMKILIACNDGCSSAVAYVTDEGILHGEDMWELDESFMSGSLWTQLPDDYPIAFMEHDYDK